MKRGAIQTRRSYPNKPLPNYPLIKSNHFITQNSIHPLCERKKRKNKTVTRNIFISWLKKTKPQIKWHFCLLHKTRPLSTVLGSTAEYLSPTRRSLSEVPPRRHWRSSCRPIRSQEKYSQAVTFALQNQIRDKCLSSSLAGHLAHHHS